jgi:glycosyltransferase involved in cell wall biosynthesis
MAERAKRTLYVCYFGLLEPLVQTQVLPYLYEIAGGGIEISLLTFEPELKKRWSRDSIAAMREEMSAKGIEWHCLSYHKRPSAIATAFDIFKGTLFIRRHIGRLDVLHGRVHVATLMAALARKLSKHEPKLLFDIRGFFPEEYVDAGIWPENGWLYRVAKRVERWLMREADGFVVLTEKAVEILVHDNPGSAIRDPQCVEVIPCCVDLERFAGLTAEKRRAMRQELGIEGRRVLVYIGSFGGWYLTDQMVDFFSAARQVVPSVFVMVLTQRDVGGATEKMREAGFSADDFLVKTVPPAELPRYLNAADAGVSFIKPCYSKQASSPTKNAEYLAAGLPIIANAGVGDVDELIIASGVGVLLHDLDSAHYVEAVRRLSELGDIKKHCREVAGREFDLVNVGGKRYLRLYRAILNERINK